MRLLKNSLLNSTQGFTLIEILVVMVIIGILAALSVGSFQSSQIKARDARRKSDLKQISLALEAFYNDHGRYPLDDNGQIVCATGVGLGNQTGTCEWGEVFQDSNQTVYMVKLPADPKTSRSYYYIADAEGTEYQLYALLENELDSQVTAGQIYTGTDCELGECNFGVHSSNSELGPMSSDSGNNNGGQPEGCGFAGCPD